MMGFYQRVRDPETAQDPVLKKQSHRKNKPTGVSVVWGNLVGEKMGDRTESATEFL